MPIIDTPDKLPSVDRLLNEPDVAALTRENGAPLVTRSARDVLASAREQVLGGEPIVAGDLVERLRADVERRLRPSLRRVINLSGTLLHTNLGRAALPQAAIDAMAEIAGGASNLEFDLDRGKRGDRHRHAEAQLCESTGAEGALVVNNNAAAVLLALNSLALRKEVPVSRGELIEIGGAFRMPDIMARAGCKLVEVGTTNRTHARDFEAAIGPKTALLMKVHTSNYAIQGFTSDVAEAELAAIAHAHDLPLLSDLGSGTLVDLAEFGLPHEPTPREILERGADLVTFSGDKLLGGPQCGIIAGRGDLLARIRKNPMLRALRVDKVTLAALSALLGLYADPARAREKIPTLRLMARPQSDIRALAERLRPLVAARLESLATVATVACESQVGSGALPVATLPSAGLALTPVTGKRGRGAALERLAAAFRALPLPVIGRIHEDRFVLDLRSLEDEAAFVVQLESLAPKEQRER